MGKSYLEHAEEVERFRGKAIDNSALIFNTKGSTGSNPIKLAQILSVFDFVIGIMGWEKKPLANFSLFLTQYQASIDGKYHNDFKDIKVAEEIERKRAERKGISILSQ